MSSIFFRSGPRTANAFHDPCASRPLIRSGKPGSANIPAPLRKHRSVRTKRRGETERPAASALHRIDIGRDLDAPELGPGMQLAEELPAAAAWPGRRTPAFDFQQETNRKRPRIRSTGGASGPSSRRPNASRAEPANAPAARHSSSLSRCRITTAISGSREDQKGTPLGQLRSDHRPVVAAEDLFDHRMLRLGGLDDHRSRLAAAGGRRGLRPASSAGTPVRRPGSRGSSASCPHSECLRGTRLRNRILS